MFYQSILIFCGFIFSMSSFAASTITSVRGKQIIETAATQFFVGSIQPSSLDGKRPYGPAYSSLVKRIVKPNASSVLECTFQQGRMFYTLIEKTDKPLVFSAKDSDGAFTGTLTYADETLSAWSYDIQVLKPTEGHITGQLPDDGAKIDSSQGSMKIRKLWNGEVLISEDYKSIDLGVYTKLLSQEVAKNPTVSVPADCK